MKKILFIFLLGIPLFSACTLESNSLTANEFVKMLESNESAQLIDIRTPQEYESGHLKGSENIDFYGADFAEKMKSFDQDDLILMYCRSGNRSGQALRFMQDAGYNNIYDLSGGIGAIGNKYPLE